MKNKAKIIAFLNAYSQGISGGDKVFLENFKRIKKFKLEIITSKLGKKLCLKNGLQASFLITSNESTFNHILITYFKRTFKALLLTKKIKQKDVILSSSDALPDVLPAYLLKRKCSDSKWIQHIFHLISNKKRLSYWAQKISLLLIRKLADIIVVDNSLLKNELFNLGFDNNKIVVNLLGVDEKFKIYPKQKSKIYDAVFMAQLRESKGIFDLIAIWKLVCKKKSSAKLAIIGKGNKNIETYIKLAINIHGLRKNIDTLGFLPKYKVVEILKSSKIFTFPTHEEGFGLAALEAQAIGLPLITWNLPVFAEIFPQGIIRAKMGSLKDFAQQIINLLQNKNDYKVYSKQALKNAKRFDWNKTAQKEQQILNSCISK